MRNLHSTPSIKLNAKIAHLIMDHAQHQDSIITQLSVNTRLYNEAYLNAIINDIIDNKVVKQKQKYKIIQHPF